jgi:hypothetical protein
MPWTVALAAATSGRMTRAEFCAGWREGEGEEGRLGRSEGPSRWYAPVPKGRLARGGALRTGHRGLRAIARAGGRGGARAWAPSRTMPVPAVALRGVTLPPNWVTWGQDVRTAGFRAGGHGCGRAPKGVRTPAKGRNQRAPLLASAPRAPPPRQGRGPRHAVRGQLTPTPRRAVPHGARLALGGGKAGEGGAPAAPAPCRAPAAPSAGSCRAPRGMPPGA